MLKSKVTRETAVINRGPGVDALFDSMKLSLNVRFTGYYITAVGTVGFCAEVNSLSRGSEKAGEVTYIVGASVMNCDTGEELEVKFSYNPETRSGHIII